MCNTEHLIQIPNAITFKEEVPIFGEMMVNFKPTLVKLKTEELVGIPITSYVVQNGQVVLRDPLKKANTICMKHQTGTKSACEYGVLQIITINTLNSMLLRIIQ